MDGLRARQAFTVFFACLLVVSMMLSPFLLSISMWGLVAAAFWEGAVKCRENGIASDLRTPPAWWRILVWSFQNLFRQRAYAFFLLLLLIPAISFFWSADKSYWLERTQVRLPFLVLPWAFVNLPELTGRQLRLVLYVLVWALTIICAGAAINFALHFEEVLAGIGRGDPVPVPRNHIRFSLMLAMGIITGGWLWLEGFYWRRRWEQWVLGAALIFLFLFIHVLSVRSGIAGLYLTLLFSLVWFVVRTKRWGTGFVALILLLLLPAIAMKTVPSFQMRVYYMLWDWQQYRQNAGNTYSDAERLISLRVGWQLWQTQPWFGIGTGDLPTEVQRVVNEQYPHYNDSPKLPHNQFLYILTGTGIFGLAFSLIAFFAPLMTWRYRGFFLFAVFQILVFTSFLVEYTIETAIGVAFYLFYSLWFMKMADKD
ncbi:MAG: hypothetical protein EPGJADBJ_01075 [Saprospiraceae bacterium]|nr:hypothetical protein [Saprospiraceae bacterium]